MGERKSTLREGPRDHFGLEAPLRSCALSMAEAETLQSESGPQAGQPAGRDASASGSATSRKLSGFTLTVP